MSGLKLKTPPKFPSLVIGGAGVDVEKANGNYTVSLDFSDLAVIDPYTPQAGHYVLIFDTVANDYFLVPAASLS